MKLRETVTALLCGAALAVGAGLSAASPAAAATPQYARLTITPVFERPGYYLVVVSGHFNTNVVQSTVGMRLKGDDVWFDDDLGISVTGQAWYGDFALSTVVWHSQLNEDPEGGDEIYANVNSSTGWRASTPNVNGRY